MQRLIEALIVSCVLFIGVAACGKAEQLYDCAALCEAYGDCAGELGEDVDEGACIDECRQKADTDEGFAQDADRCVNCLDEAGTCSDNFPCANQCVDVLPDVIF
jgi:hypothetical protein